jgi:large subunit ribosomal protein L10
MQRTEKQKLVDELSAKLTGASAVYYTDFTGLKVKGMTELRRRLRKAGVKYVVIKNTLALRAITGQGMTGTKLSGPTGIVIGKDPVAAAKVLTEFAKENEDKPHLKGGMLDGVVIDAAQVKRLATLPSRQQMLAQLGQGLQSPLAGFVGALNGLLSTWVGALTALHAQREAAEQGATEQGATEQGATEQGAEGKG